MTVDDDCGFSATFFDALADLAKALLEHDLAVYENQYNYFAFGSWTLIVGTSHRRLRFEFDGKEDWLEVLESEFQNQGSQPQWKSVDTRQLERGSGVNPSRVFELVLAMSKDAFEK